jgi:anti-sigma factor RsiW
MSECDEQLLGAYFDGELDAAGRATVEAHLRDCPACARQIELLAGAAKVLRDYPFHDITALERARLHQAVENVAVDRPIWRIGGAMGLIAASILIVGLAWLRAIPATMSAAPNAGSVAVAPAQPWERVAITLRDYSSPQTVSEDETQLAVADWHLSGLSGRVMP